ncbi:NAD(P)-binding protein [Ascobolus immersus RN42]|uniref:NAD(P)-binding protein n=1 Tax=Ascobolus immersus RN42 TaxID=1160509 RepID=A0A3N4I9R5_ASCIM|nr:NAD(P)-binding protein [Ascobolus immersus RN42]
MSNIKNITIVGSKSVLTQHIVSALIAAAFNVTILSRLDTAVEQSAFPPSVVFKSADYASHESLVEALKGTDAVISLIGAMGLASQLALIDAAVSAGVKRFIPSEFGSDLQNAKTRALPFLAAKLPSEERLAKAHEESGLEYDLVVTGLFLEFGLFDDVHNLNLLGVSIPNRVADFIDGGNVKISSSSLPFVGSAVASILQHPARNGFVRVWNMQKTSREVLTVIQEFTGTEDWKYLNTTSEELRTRAMALLQTPEGLWPSIGLQVKVAIGGEGYGNDFNNDNERLGLKALTDEEFKAIVKEAVEKAGAAKK